MSRIIEVEYMVKVYAHVDLDEGKVVRVEQDEDVTPTGITPGSGVLPTEEDCNEAQRIADSDDDWPAWERG